MKHIIRLFLCPALLLAVLFSFGARAEADPIRCVPGETIEITLVLPGSTDQTIGAMGTLIYDYSIFALLPSSSVLGQNGVYLSNQPVSLSFFVSQYAPVGTYVIEVMDLDVYDADGRLLRKVSIDPIQVSVVPASYSVRYEPGAEDSGIRDIPGPQEKAFRKTITLSSVRPARAGYDFMGWAAAAGGKAVYQPGDAYQDDQDVTLYAVWQPIPTGKLDVNGWLDDDKNAGSTDGYGTFDVYIDGKLVKGNVSDFSEDVPAGSTYEIKNIKPANNRVYVTVTEGALQGTVNSGKTMSVRLKFLSTYTIEFSKNTTESVSSMPSAQKKQHGLSLTLSRLVPTRSNYTFKGWATTAGGDVKYNIGTTYTENKNITLYAVWKPMGILDVNGWLDDNKTSGNTGNYGTFDMYINGKLEKDDVNDYFGYVPADCTYEIRDIKPSNGHIYADITEGELKGTVESGKRVDIRLKFLSTYTIEFNKNTTDSVSSMPSPQKKQHGQNLTLSSQVPARSNYTFKGWATTAGGDVKYSSGAICTENKNLTLYAVWQPTLTGKLDVNGWLDGNKNAGGTDNYGTFDMYINGKLVKDDVYDFWEDVPAGCTYEIKDIKPAGNRVYVSVTEGALQGTVDAGKTVNVRLKFLSTYTIAYNKNTTDSVSNMPSAQKKEYGAIMFLSNNTPTRTGYKFQGWSLSSSGTVKYQPGATCTENANTTLYAVWQSIDWLNVPVNDAIKTVNSLIEESKRWSSAKDVPYTFQSFPIHPAIDLTQKDAITGLDLPDPFQYDNTFKRWLYNTDTKKYDTGAYQDGLYEGLTFHSSSLDNDWFNEIYIWRQGKIYLFRCSYSNYEGGSWTVSFSTGESYTVSKNKDGSTNSRAVYEITLRFNAKTGKCIYFDRET